MAGFGNDFISRSASRNFPLDDPRSRLNLVVQFGVGEHDLKYGLSLANE
jgi:hypothetical protein